jgi:F-type H+-transporting ATPase subunit b
MLRKAVFVVGIGFVVMALAIWTHPKNVKAAQTPEAPAHEGHAATAKAAEGASEEPNPMQPQPALAIWTVVVFVGLLLLLGKYAWGPLIQALHQREEHLEHCLLQTEKARNESEQILAEHKRLMVQADDRVRSMLDKAQKDAQAGAEEIIRLAQAEAEAARDRARREISTARDQALAEIWTQTANIAVSVAGRILTKQLGEEEHRRLLDLAIKELPAAPGPANGHGGSHT